MDIDNKTPDYYAVNHGVIVTRETRFPESGQVNVRIALNQYQSTILAVGLEQAKDLRDKLSNIIAEIEEQ